MASKTVQRALEHMRASGELRIYIGAGDRCLRPPKIGSGVIVSDIGRIEVSRLTVKRLREVGTKRHYRDYHYGRAGRPDTFDGWETL